MIKTKKCPSVVEQTIHLDPLPSLYTIIGSNWFKKWNVKIEAVKRIGLSIYVNIFDILMGKGFFSSL